jgi:acetylcholinesterase
MVLKNITAYFSGKLAKNLGCEFNSSDIESTLDCLREKPSTEIVEYQSSVETYSLNLFPFLPTVDGYFLTDTPKNLLENGLFKNVSVIMGSNANEGFW